MLQLLRSLNVRERSVVAADVAADVVVAVAADYSIKSKSKFFPNELLSQQFQGLGENRAFSNSMFQRGITFN